MRRARFIRFVLLGASGFAVAGALVGVSWPLLPLTAGASLLLVILAGAIAGASLGWALEDRRKTVILAALGAAGFTVGGIVAVFAGFIGLLPATEGGALNAMGAGASGVIVGAVGGASLGLAFGDAKRVAILVLAGALGCGMGLLIKFSLEGTFQLGFFREALLATAGIIGGAVMGATVGYLERPARHPRERKLLRLGALVSVPLLLGLFVLFVVLPFRSICGEEERAAFSEIPQYGGAEGSPESDSMSGGCVATYETSAPPEEIAAYLSERLRQQGWTVEDQMQVEGNTEGGFVTAHRDGLKYSADYESLRIYDPPRPGTHVVVRVFEDR
jgi:hypothetical protein